MDAAEIASLREQIFDHSPTHTPTSDLVPSTEQSVDNPTTDLPPADTPNEITEETNTPSIDFNAYVKENFGFDNVEDAKAQIAELKALKETAPKPL